MATRFPLEAVLRLRRMEEEAKMKEFASFDRVFVREGENLTGLHENLHHTRLEPLRIRMPREILVMRFVRRVQENRIESRHGNFKIGGGRYRLCPAGSTRHGSRNGVDIGIRKR